MAPRAPELPPYQRPTFTRNASSQSKVSVPSISQSNEADDEQSLSSDQSLDMESNDSQPHYEGEDTRLTSDKELRGFYMYGWAAEVLIPMLSTTIPTCFTLLQAFTMCQPCALLRCRVAAFYAPCRAQKLREHHH
ncbi:Autophagy-related protein 22-2 [Alternaria alternata]|jgi:hypothetical protein|nr:Autophagy-related protein 22-2 [Alternaria alternata]